MFFFENQFVATLPPESNQCTTFKCQAELASVVRLYILIMRLFSFHFVWFYHIIPPSFAICCHMWFGVMFMYFFFLTSIL